MYLSFFGLFDPGMLSDVFKMKDEHPELRIFITQFVSTYLDHVVHSVAVVGCRGRELEVRLV